MSGRFILFSLLFPIFCFTAAVTIYNDSAFPLTATILDATGQIKGKVTVAPQHQMKWQDSQQNITTFSETPFTVIFTCPDGTEFGVASGVPQSSFVSANSSSGRHYCKPKKQRQNPRHGDSEGLRNNPDSVGEQIDSKKEVNPNQFKETDMY